MSGDQFDWAQQGADNKMYQKELKKKLYVRWAGKRRNLRSSAISCRPTTGWRETGTMCKTIKMLFRD